MRRNKEVSDGFCKSVLYIFNKKFESILAYSTFYEIFQLLDK